MTILVTELVLRFTTADPHHSIELGHIDCSPYIELGTLGAL